MLLRRRAEGTPIGRAREGCDCPEQFDFSHLSAAGTDTKYRAHRIDLAPFERAELLLRPYGGDLPNGTKVDIEIVCAGSTDEDPSQTFLGSTALASIEVGPSTHPARRRPRR